MLGCRPEDRWLDIGAGHGEMTAVLAEQAARVVAVETDPRLVLELGERFAHTPNVEVVSGDILHVSVPELAERAGGRLRVYGNLPYYISSPILSHLFASLAIIEDIFVVVQREVAERLVATPGQRDYGYLSAVTQFYTTPHLLLRLSPGAFRPAPRVHSALVELTPPGTGQGVPAGEAGEFVRFLGLCFRQKRKTLFNNLRRALPAERVRRGLAARGWSERARAEELSVSELWELYAKLKP